MFKDLAKQINETNLIRIKVYSILAVFSLVFSIINVAIGTYCNSINLGFIIPFSIMFAIMGIIGTICFVINLCEVLENSSRTKDE